MSVENQAARGPGAEPAPPPALEFPLEESGTSAAPGPAPPSPLPRSVLHGAFALALLGFGALLLGQVEAAFLVAVAVFYFVAQSAGVYPSLGRLQALLAWLPPVAGAFLLGALTYVSVTDGPHAHARLAFAVFTGLGALVSLATLLRPVVDTLVRLLFRGASPDHTLRLTARVALVALWLGLPAGFAYQDEIADLLQDPGRLVGAPRLVGGLIGYVVLGFASVGLFVRRGWRESLQRLGLTGLRPADAVAVAAGVVALWLFNAGSEGLEKSAFPVLWARDQRFAEALAGVMGPGQMVLLGLSTGIGEEVVLRGALQPRLGIALTALLFAVLHVQYSWYGMLSILVFGLILGLIRRRRNTTAAIAVHALYNLLAVAAAKT